MKTWMSKAEVSEYLGGVPESKIQELMSKGFPYHEKFEILLFNREEVDNWMKEPEPAADEKVLSYRGKPIMSYTLTASRILCGEKPWHQIGKFVKAAAEIAGRRHRDFVTRDDLIETGKNFNDYLRVCCQLGLFKKRDAGGRRKAYMLTPFAKLIAADPEQKNAQKAILNSINEIVTREDEYQSDQGERHAVFLLWYYLKLKERGVTPTEVHFRRQAENNYFPLIRLQFTTGLYRYLFNSNNIDEIDFITGWDSILKEQRTHNQW